MNILKKNLSTFFCTKFHVNPLSPACIFKSFHIFVFAHEYDSGLAKGMSSWTASSCPGRFFKITAGHSAFYICPFSENTLKCPTIIQVKERATQSPPLATILQVSNHSFRL